jgi:hypothetical protein
LEQIADRHFDGHFTVMKFTTNWRVSFGGQPDGREAIQKMAEGPTLPDAVAGAIEQFLDEKTL